MFGQTATWLVVVNDYGQHPVADVTIDLECDSRKYDMFPDPISNWSCLAESRRGLTSTSPTIQQPKHQRHLETQPARYSALNLQYYRFCNICLRIKGFPHPEIRLLFTPTLSGVFPVIPLPKHDCYNTPARRSETQSTILVFLVADYTHNRSQSLAIYPESRHPTPHARPLFLSCRRLVIGLRVNWCHCGLWLQMACASRLCVG